ncbi:hypothetical protein NBRC110019_06620 [Neptunitalea chrysea]|uniref:DUF2141 domain-containing protein n=1 Tax=Neptunitalea chrysea TaxID=1647581 RepID=A0A9W6EVJ7_9FLAO|nr:DUF2141 domain-containing protein [Neptunitalea chrysea]GLB51623.1 hypothetical protein NBRC110019_06620 [Neptunitalea chrysea]
MKSLVTLLLFVFTSVVSYSQSTDTATITAKVANVTNNNGKVIFGLHTAETFLKSKGVQTVIATIENGVAKASFENVAPGTYAILVLHDENENMKMDYTVNGIPKESYGCSNNPMPFGPPQFNGSKFEVSGEDKTLEIRF